MSDIFLCLESLEDRTILHIDSVSLSLDGKPLYTDLLGSLKGSYPPLVLVKFSYEGTIFVVPFKPDAPIDKCLPLVREKLETKHFRPLRERPYQLSPYPEV